MASTAAQLAALASDVQFKGRVQSLLVQQASTIYGEAPTALSAVTLANPGVITATHGLTVGKSTTITVAGSNCTPSIDGAQQVYVVDSTHLRTTVNVTVAGTAGSFTVPARAALALTVMANPGDKAHNIAAVIANRPNLVAANTTYDFVAGHFVTDAIDGALSSQLATDWNMLAGV